MQAFYRKLFWVWLSQLGKLFYNDPTTIVEVTHVDATHHSVFFFFEVLSFGFCATKART